MLRSDRSNRKIEGESVRSSDTEKGTICPIPLLDN